MIENPTLEQLSKLEGIIYLITNNINKKQYVGKTKVTFRKRYRACRWWKNPSNSHLKHAANKYGPENFSIDIIESNIKEIEKLNQLEIYYIKKLNTLYPNGYNYFPGGEGITHTDETKKLASERQAGDFVFYDHKLDKEIKVHNLYKFCQENNLQDSLMSILSTKDVGRKRHKQYTLPGVKIKKWKLLSPDNREYIILEGELRNFCKQNNLNKAGIFQMTEGNYSHHKGWKLIEFIK